LLTIREAKQNKQRRSQDEPKKMNQNRLVTGEVRSNWGRDYSSMGLELARKKENYIFSGGGRGREHKEEICQQGIGEHRVEENLHSS